MHTAGFVHRDLKLENVFLDAAGAARLGDFGLALSLHEVRPYLALHTSLCQTAL